MNAEATREVECPACGDLIQIGLALVPVDDAPVAGTVGARVVSLRLRVDKSMLDDHLADHAARAVPDDAA